MGRRFGVIGFFAFSLMGVNLAFCSGEIQEQKRMYCGKERSQEGLKKMCFHERGMTDGMVCVYKAKPDSSGCSSCKKKKSK